jgi:subtilisin family serine protease
MIPLYWLNISVPYSHNIEVFGGYRRVRSYWTGYTSFFLPENPKFKNLQKRKVLILKPNREEELREYRYGDSEFQVKTVRADTLHKLGFTGKGVKIAIFDTGFDLTHPSLMGVQVRGQMDFNSGDRINLNGRTLPTPEGVFYIHSYDCAIRGTDTFCVYSGIDERSIAGININRWDLYLVKGETLKVLSRGFEINPSLTVRNDTLYLSWSSYGNLKLGAIYRDTLESAQDLGRGYMAILRSSSSGLKVGVFTGDSVKLCDYITSLICSISKPVKGFGGMFLSGDSLFFSDGDSIFLFKGSSYSFLVEGFYPVENSGRLAYIRNDSLFVDNAFVLKVPYLEDFALYSDTLAVPMEDYISLYSLSLRREIRRVGWTFCNRPKFLNGVLVYRERGDTIAEVPRYGVGKYHGTRVLSVLAGYVGGSLVGIAPGAEYYLAKTEKVSRSDTTSQWENRIEEDFLVSALEWASRKGVQIINISLGYGGDVGYTKGMMDGKTAISSIAMSKALDRGVLPVISVGNVSSRAVDPNVGDTTLNAPADAFDVISVGGVIYDSVRKRVVLSSSSACGPSADGRVKPEVVAPFEVIAADEGGRLVYTSGTSYSAPITAGVLALALEAHPSWSLSKLRDKLLETAKPLEDIPFKPNFCSGYGLVDAQALAFSEPLEVIPKKGKLFFSRIYPNPTGGSRFVNLRIKSMYPSKDPVIRVYTPLGIPVKEVQIKGEKNIGEWEYRLDVGDLKEGLYFVVIMTENGKAVGKFVITRP